jgi:hypothetical protein
MGDKDIGLHKPTTGKSWGAMQTSEQAQSVLAVDECVESIAGGLREILYIHNVPIGGRTLAHLRHLAGLTVDNAGSVRQVAQTLLTFLERRQGEVPITCDRNQIVLLLDSLRRQIRPAAENPFEELGVLGKASAYSKQPTCLFPDSMATKQILDEVANSSGQGVANICGLPHVVVNEEIDRPLTIIADLSTLRDDPLARSKIARLRQAHPQSQLFCLSSATHFAARLEAVRLGASRHLIKQFDIDRLIAMLDGVSTRKETLPFPALLVDSGRALMALHAQAVRAATRKAETSSTVLYPDAIASEVYVAGCWSLKLGVDKSVARTDGAQEYAAS